MSVRQLIINPGSTSTKVAVYEDLTQICQASIQHSEEDLKPFKNIYEQVPFRTEAILSFLKENGIPLSSLDIVMCRGGLVWGIGTGAYEVSDELASILQNEEYTSPHASALGGIIGKKIADQAGVRAYIYDAVTGASLPMAYRVTGFPDIVRKSSCHVLNCKATARQYASDINVPFEDLRLICAHLGGGISFCAIENGEIIDSIGDDDGAFSPERSGFTQILPIVKMCYSGKYTYEEMKAKIRGKGGLKAYLGTADAKEIEQMIRNGDRKAKLIYEAQAYQISKGLGELSVALSGKIDALILTGGLAYSKLLTDMITERVSFIAPVVIYPGEKEMEALAAGGYRILSGQESAKTFSLEKLEEDLKLTF